MCLAQLLFPHLHLNSFFLTLLIAALLTLLSDKHVFVHGLPSIPTVYYQTIYGRTLSPLGELHTHLPSTIGVSPSPFCSPPRVLTVLRGQGKVDAELELRFREDTPSRMGMFSPYCGDCVQRFWPVFPCGTPETWSWFHTSLRWNLLCGVWSRGSVWPVQCLLHLK